MDNEAFASLVKYGGIVALKVILMSPLTTLLRMAKNSYRTEEDYRSLVGVTDKDKIKRLLADKDPHVERVRAAHRNDLENVVPFFIVSALYLATKPDPATATMLFQAFAAFRIAHTVVYLAKAPQPARFLCFGGGFAVNLFMAIKSLWSVW